MKKEAKTMKKISKENILFILSQYLEGNMADHEYAFIVKAVKGAKP